MPVRWTDEEMQGRRGSWLALAGLVAGFAVLVVSLATAMLG